MEHLIRIIITRLVSNGMEITSIPAFIRNVANSIAANPSLSLEDLNGHLHSLGWDDFVLDVYSFYLVMAILESDLVDGQIPSLDPIFKEQGLHKISHGKERILPIQADNHDSLQE